MLDTRILQFNCGLTNYRATRPVLDAANPSTHQVLAIQEQAFNRATESTYCPRGFILGSDNDPASKVCFMVSKKIPSHTWSFHSHGRHVASLHIQLASCLLSMATTQGAATQEFRHGTPYKRRSTKPKGRSSYWGTSVPTTQPGVDRKQCANHKRTTFKQQPPHTVSCFSPHVEYQHGRGVHSKASLTLPLPRRLWKGLSNSVDLWTSGQPHRIIYQLTFKSLLQRQRLLKANDMQWRSWTRTGYGSTSIRATGCMHNAHSQPCSRHCKVA